MRARALVRIDALHDAVFRRLDRTAVRDLCDEIACRKGFRIDWDAVWSLIDRRDPGAFVFLLGNHARSLRWNVAVAVLTNATYYVNNGGYALLHECGVILQTYLVRNDYV